MALTKIDDRGLNTPIDLLDNEKIRLGTGNDLEFVHNGTDSEIKGTTGSLTIKKLMMMQFLMKIMVDFVLHQNFLKELMHILQLLMMVPQIQQRILMVLKDQYFLI